LWSCVIFLKIGQDWNFGKKCHQKLFVPKKKPKHNLAKLGLKKCDTVTDDHQQVILCDQLLFIINKFIYFQFFNSVDDYIIRL